MSVFCQQFVWSCALLSSPPLLSSVHIQCYLQQSGEETPQRQTLHAGWRYRWSSNVPSVPSGLNSLLHTWLSDGIHHMPVDVESCTILTTTVFYDPWASIPVFFLPHPPRSFIFYAFLGTRTIGLVLLKFISLQWWGAAVGFINSLSIL